MTKTIDTSSAHADTYIALIKFLRNIDKKYLPIVHKEYDSVDGHIKEFLQLFVDQEGHGLIAFVPIFLEIRDWNKWSIEFGDKYYGIAYCEPDIFNTKYTAEDYLYSISKLGFSQTILKSQNSRDLDGNKDDISSRKTLVISKGVVDGERYIDPIKDEEDNSVLFFTVREDIVNEINKICDCCGQYSETPIKGKFFDLQRIAENIKKLESITYINTLVQRSMKSVKEDSLLHVPIIHHSPYLDDKRYLYYFISNTVEQNKSGKSLGGIYVLVDKSKLAIPTCKKDCPDFFDLWERLTEKLAVRIIHYYDHEQKINHALKAAISQVMARNMSHNIGSHVLSRFMNHKDIQSVDGAQSQYLYNRNLLNNPFAFKGGDSNEDKKNKLLALFNMYLKNRMDFLADIATSDPSIEYPMLFDVDIISMLYHNEILLSRISGANDIINYRIILIGDQTAIVSVTNGVLGAQALYIIIENIIRNTYKHGRPDRNLLFTLELKRIEQSDFYELDIYDNNYKSKEEIEKTANERNNTFNKDVLSNNILRSEGLGSIEMMVCAAYLRCLPLISIKSKKIRNSNNPLIQARCKEDRDKYSLAYRIYMNKPKNVLVICSDYCDILTGIDGIKFIDEINPDDVYNYQFLYDPGRIIGRNNSILPKRVVNKNIFKSCEIKDLDYVMSELWKEYIGAKLNGEQFKNIDFQINNCNNSLVGNSFRSFIGVGNNSQNCRNIIIYIDNHADNYDDENIYYYYDMAMSHTTIMRKISDITINFHDNENKKIIEICEYFESVITSIVIIDERIQDCIMTRNDSYPYNGKKVIWGDYFKKQKLYIPTVAEVNLNKPDFIGEGEHSVKRKLQIYLNAENIKKSDFYLIHLGVLEKMIGTGHSVSDVIKELFPAIDNNKIVIMSGRGTPNNLPDGISFLPISLVQDAIEVKHDKCLLSKILYNSRPNKKER